MGRFAQRYDLIRHLVRRDFTLRYHASALGVLWSVLLPLTQLLILVFLFRRVLPLGIEAYPAFLFSALLPWAWLSTCLSSAGSLFLGNRDLVRRPGFAPPVLIVVNTLSNLLTYLVSLPILLGVLVFYDRPLTLALLAFPIVIAIQGVLTVGLGLMVATLNVFYRDVQHIVSVGLTLLFYLTPVFYDAKSVGGAYALVFRLNPIAVLIEQYRAIFFYGAAPAWSSLLASALAGIVVCGIGYGVYTRQRHDMIDVM
jgi:ABC-type polysaccharide/polyol phosphate export permease